jgi:signal transduction histidine kinase
MSPHSHRVLLIEDNPGDARLIKELLSECAPGSFELKWAESLSRGFEILGKEGIDTILLDLSLPESQGFETFAKVLSRTPGVPIIILTGFDDETFAINAVQQGAQDYLIKGLVGSHLLARAILYAIERKRTEEALRKIQNELELRVQERTAELEKANEELRGEIAERQKAEEALQKSAEKMKRFAYSVSHDLKSPAIGVHGLTKLLFKNYNTVLGTKGKTYCEQILRSSEQLLALVEKINLYISAKEAPLLLEEINLQHLFQIIKDEFSIRFSIRSIQWSVPDDCPVIKADRLALLRVLRNLVDNALKYGGEDLSRIAIGYEEGHQHHIISVKDDGVGVEIEDRTKIFDVFQRKCPVEEIEGSGLGLAIVKEICEQHGGEVWLQPAPERGCIFYVALAKPAQAQA